MELPSVRAVNVVVLATDIAATVFSLLQSKPLMEVFHRFLPATSNQLEHYPGVSRYVVAIAALLIRQTSLLSWSSFPYGLIYCRVCTQGCCRRLEVSARDQLIDIVRHLRVHLLLVWEEIAIRICEQSQGVSAAAAQKLLTFEINPNWRDYSKIGALLKGTRL
jgi:hypothetical protein